MDLPSISATQKGLQPTRLAGTMRRSGASAGAVWCHTLTSAMGQWGTLAPKS
jgi:hypothetical protein